MDLKAVDPEYEQRMVQFEMDCDRGKGDAWACHAVGEFLAVVKGNYEKAGKIYETNCRKYKHPPSCFNMGRLYLGGRGVDQSDENAVKCFETSCAGGHGMGCHHMGILLLYGQEGGYDVKQDAKRAESILGKACDESIADSCYALASHLLRHAPDGKRERDPLKAKTLLEKGCDRGHGPSCFNLAVMYKKGDKGIPSNPAEYLKYKKITEELIQQTGSLNWKKGH